MHVEDWTIDHTRYTVWAVSFLAFIFVILLALVCWLWKGPIGHLVFFILVFLFMALFTLSIGLIFY